MSRAASLRLVFAAPLAAGLPVPCTAPPTGEGEGGTEGEGEGHVVATAVLLRDLAGARTEEPFDLHGALPVAAGVVSGIPTVIAEELAGGAFTGALLVFVPPFADPRPLRIAQAFPAADGAVSAAWAIGDLDANGHDLDVDGDGIDEVIVARVSP